MKDKLILLSTAKLAKEKGFDIDQNSKGKFRLSEIPSQSMLQKWLRDKTLVEVFVEKYLHKYIAKIIDYDGGITNFYTNHFSTYEKALEAGLRMGLKLITTKQKQL